MYICRKGDEEVKAMYCTVAKHFDYLKTLENQCIKHSLKSNAFNISNSLVFSNTLRVTAVKHGFNFTCLHISFIFELSSLSDLCYVGGTAAPVRAPRRTRILASGKQTIFLTVNLS